MNANYTVYDQVLLDFRDLGDGETKAGQICPSCKGGSSKEGSLSVTRRDGSLLFICHRASCSFKGTVSTTGAGGGSSVKGGKPNSVYPRVKTYGIDEATLNFLATKYRIPREVLRAAGLKWTGDEYGYLGRRVCFPIHGYDFKERGANYRSYEEGITPKAVIDLRSPDEIKASWYRWPRSSPAGLFLVEDQMSAIKLAPHAHVVALLGTEVSDKLVEEINDGNYSSVHICLDNDATYQAIKMHIRLSNRIKNLKVIGLGQDIKDMTTGEFDEFLQEHVHKAEHQRTTLCP